jgi:hypothetical protein
MTYLENIDVYYSTQVYFAKNIIPRLPNDDKVWSQEYRRWLAEQGAWVVPAQSPRIIRNALGFAPGYDNIAFENPQDLTMFILRWS